MPYAAMLTRYGYRTCLPGPGPPHERLGLHKLRPEVSSCSVQELTALDTDQSSRGPGVP